MTLHLLGEKHVSIVQHISVKNDPLEIKFLILSTPDTKTTQHGMLCAGTWWLGTCFHGAAA